MIVKNEAHIILEGLKCIYPLIDTYVIFDTGSTDNTKSVIKSFFDGKGIQGHIYDSQWKDFGTNRSEALKMCEGKMDYAIVFDADDLIHFPSNGKQILKANLEKFNVALMRVLEGDGVMKHFRMQIFKIGDDWQYIGVLHEFPTNFKPENKILKLPDEFYMISRRLGDRNRKTKKEKLEDDLQLLQTALISEPTNERYIFYVAQLNAELGRYDEAIQLYKKRLDINTPFAEELFFVIQLRLAMCYAAKNNLIEAEYWGQLAFQTRPSRSESLFFLARCFRVSGQYHKAYHYLLQGRDIPYPKNDLFFVEVLPYYGGFERELCLVEYNIFPHLKESCVKRIMTNYFFTEDFDFKLVKPLISQIKGVIKPVCVDVNLFQNKFKPSAITVLHDTDLMIVRYIDYEVKNGLYTSLNEDTERKNIFSTKNVLLNTATYEMSEIQVDNRAPFLNTNKHRGIEDVRVYKFNGDLFFTGVSNGEYIKDSVCIVHGSYDACQNVFKNVKGVKSPFNQVVEKNWLHIPDTDTFIYSWYPLRLCKIRDDKCIVFKVIETPKYFSLFRGSAPPVKIGNKLLVLVHMTYLNENHDREFYHSFIEMIDDGTYAITRVSFPFYFRKNNSIEFCLCIKYNLKENFIDCYTSLNDADPAVVSVNLDDVVWNQSLLV